MLKYLEERIKFLKTHGSQLEHSNKNSFKIKSIAVPTHKANGNITFICKRFYVQTFVRELGLTINKTSKTYTMVNNVSELDIVNNY